MGDNGFQQTVPDHITGFKKSKADPLYALKSFQSMFES